MQRAVVSSASLVMLIGAVTVLGLVTMPVWKERQIPPKICPTCGGRVLVDEHAQCWHHHATACDCFWRIRERRTSIPRYFSRGLEDDPHWEFGTCGKTWTYHLVGCPQAKGSVLTAWLLKRVEP